MELLKIHKKSKCISLFLVEKGSQSTWIENFLRYHFIVHSLRTSCRMTNSLIRDYIVVD